MPARRAQLGGAGLCGSADAFTVVFDQDIKPEPFHQRPVVLALLAAVHRAGREPVPADDRLVGADVIGAPVRAEVDQDRPVPVPGRQLFCGARSGDVGGEVRHGGVAAAHLPDALVSVHAGCRSMHDRGAVQEHADLHLRRPFCSARLARVPWPAPAEGTIGALLHAGPAGLKDVDGLGQLPGAPGAAAELAHDAPGLELGIGAFARAAEPGVSAVGVLL